MEYIQRYTLYINEIELEIVSYDGQYDNAKNMFPESYLSYENKIQLWIQTQDL